MRRRRARYTWFPTNPTFAVESSNPGVNYFQDTFAETGGVGGTDPFTTIGAPQAIPLLLDSTAQAGIPADAGDFTLRDLVEGQDYIVKRIVGKVWASRDQRDETNVSSIPTITAIGLAVLPEDDATGQPALNPDDYNPLLQQNSAAPWLWRRTWVLGNTFPSGSLSLQQATAQSTWQYGSMADGGHLDSKVARRVTREQRLYLVFATGTLNIGLGAGDSVGIYWGYDLRILGAMRKAKNRSTFK